MTAAQAYRLLGLAPGCSERDLTRQFRHLARLTHPDLGGSNEEFSNLAHAYTVVVDDRIRGEHAVEITTHVTSVSGRLKILRRQARHQFHQLTRPHHIRSRGGHQ